MAEVPPHLLDRSRSRRAALGLGGEGAPAAAETTPESTPAPASAAPARAGATAVAVLEATPAPRVSQLAEPPAAKPPAKPRIPTWMLPVVVSLPVWMFFYVGSFATSKNVKLTPLQLGIKLYAEKCSSCHTSNGAGDTAGGVGRQLNAGQVELTFPKAEDHIAYVRHGSCATGAPYGARARAGGQHVARGGMPAFASLSPEQITAVVVYERTILSAKPFPTDEELAAIPLDVDPASACGG